MDGNNFENNNQNGQNNTAGNGQYTNYQNSNYQNNGAPNSQYSNYQNNGYQNNGGAYNQYGNYQDNTANIPYQAPVVNSAANNRANGLQIAGLVCGILAICACWCYGIVSVILGIAGLICSILGNNRNKHGVGIAGLVCSIIGLILGIAALIYFIWAIQYLDSMGYWDIIFDNYYR